MNAKAKCKSHKWLLAATALLLCSPPGGSAQAPASSGSTSPWWYGQELSLLYGQMNTPDGQNSTFSWQVDFRKNLSRYFSVSADYLNEGHIVNHKRDGGGSFGADHLSRGLGRLRGFRGQYLYGFQGDRHGMGIPSGLRAARRLVGVSLE